MYHHAMKHDCAQKATATHIQLTLTSPSARVSPDDIIAVRITELARCATGLLLPRYKSVLAETIKRAAAVGQA